MLPGTVAELCSEVVWRAHRLSEALHASSQGVRHHSPLPIGAPNSAGPPRIIGVKAQGSRSGRTQGLTDEPRLHRIRKEERTLSLRFGCECWIFPRQLCSGQSSIPVQGSGTGRGLRSPMPTIAPKALPSCWGRQQLPGGSAGMSRPFQWCFKQFPVTNPFLPKTASFTFPVTEPDRCRICFCISHLFLCLDSIAVVGFVLLSLIKSTWM